MLEIVFGESAGGSLKIAQSYGRGEYRGGCMSVFMRHEDGRDATPEEIEAKRREIEEQNRREWEEAVPLGGNAGDVFEFGLGLGFGDISRENFWENRKQALRKLLCWPGAQEHVCSLIDSAREKLEVLLERAKSEPVRIWYSSNPDEICGMHWVMAQLGGACTDVRLVRLPDWETRGEILLSHSGWGEIGPGDWHRYLKYEESAAPVFRRACVARWRELEEENTPLRAELSGRLAGFPEDIYDHFIRQELAAQPEEFHQARFIGDVIAKHHLGDGFIALRMEKMIENGELVPATEAGEGNPVYRRILRKRS